MALSCAFSARHKPEAWLFTILKNTFRANIRRTRRQVAWQDHIGARLAQAPDQEASLLETALAAALAALHHDQRAALLSVMDDDLPYAQAGRLEITISALKTRIFRASRGIASFPEHGVSPGRNADALATA